MLHVLCSLKIVTRLLARPRLGSRDPRGKRVSIAPSILPSLEESIPLLTDPSLISSLQPLLVPAHALASVMPLLCDPALCRLGQTPPCVASVRPRLVSPRSDPALCRLLVQRAILAIWASLAVSRGSAPSCWPPGWCCEWRPLARLQAPLVGRSRSSACVGSGSPSNSVRK